MDVSRLDKFLTATGRIESRTKAVYEIRQGNISVNGKIIKKASCLVSGDDVVEIRGKSLEYVGKAALKLKGFLEYSGLPVSGNECCDVGSSTGGFTQVLLERGAGHVTAIDVGTEQMHESLRNHPRILLLEKTDFRDYFGNTEKTFDLITADLSFISLKKLVPFIRERGETAVLLFKPQFETEKKLKNKKGVVTDLDVHRRILLSFTGYLLKEGLIPFIIRRSVILGGEGNREYFFACGRSALREIGDRDIEREVYRSEDFIDS